MAAAGQRARRRSAPVIGPGLRRREVVEGGRSLRDEGRSLRLCAEERPGARRKESLLEASKRKNISPAKKKKRKICRRSPEYLDRSPRRRSSEALRVPVPPAAAAAHFSGGKKPHFFLGADTEHAPENQAPSKASPSEEHLVPPEAGDSLSSPSPEPASVSLHSQFPEFGTYLAFKIGL
ncbi:UNVERIFIED_CONTAM: hypothetical protein K2H54_018483 [Gekko kuhli]